jgi:hypothetical protein
MGGQLKGKTGSLAQSAIAEKPSAVTLHNFLNDGQAQPGRSRFAAGFTPELQAASYRLAKKFGVSFVVGRLE